MSDKKEPEPTISPVERVIETEVCGEEDEDSTPIIIHQFVQPNVESWVQEAQKHLDNNEPVIAFICAWIAFNYCYGLFWTNLRNRLRKERRRKEFPSLFGHDHYSSDSECMTDHVQVAVFINNSQDNPAFDSFWKSFVQRKDDSMVQEIKLPVIHLDSNEAVPCSAKHKTKLISM